MHTKLLIFAGKIPFFTDFLFVNYQTNTIFTTNYLYNYCMEIRKSFLDRRAILGLILVLLGVLFLGENVGLIKTDVKEIVFSWQMLVILIGVVSLSHRGSNMFSYALIAIGGFFMVPEIFNIPVSFGRVFWPLCLVMFGVSILFRKHRRPPWCHEAEKYSADVLDEVNVFSGSERKITSKAFRGGKITSVFGGSSYDMLECELSDGDNVLDIVFIFGGIKMLVPSDWQVHVEVVSVFGGFADKRRSTAKFSANPNKVLYIKGMAIFGGGEIKNF
jgi:predicted membrane protein